MSLIKRSVVLYKDQTKGVFTVIRLGETVGAKLVLNEPIKKPLWVGLKLGDDIQQNHEITKQVSEFELNCTLCFNDSIGVILLDDSGSVYAYGGVKEKVSVSLIKEAMVNAKEAEIITKPEPLAKPKAEPVLKIKAEPESATQTVIKTATEKIVAVANPQIVEKAESILEGEPVLFAENAETESITTDTDIENYESVVESEYAPMPLSEPNPAHAHPPTLDAEEAFKKSRISKPSPEVQEEKIERVEVSKEEKTQPQWMPESDKKSTNPFNIPKAKNFYQAVRGRLEEIMTINPKEPELERLIMDSDWVKVKYDGEEYYVVGRLYENNIVTYIGYGVPGVENVRPPKEADELCDFLPLPNKQGAGYWLMFQKADDGTISKDLQ